MNIGKIFIKGSKVLRRVAFKNAETICAGVGAVAFTVCIVETVKAVPKVTDIYNEKKEDFLSCAKDDKEAKKEVVKEAIKEITPLVVKPAISGAVCLSTMIASPIISKKKQAALAVAYSLSEQTAELYDKKLEEIVGKKKADEVREAVAQEKAAPFNGGGIVETGHGSQLFFMMSTGVWFRSSPDYVRLVFSRINERLNDYESIDFNEALEDLGLERCSLADSVGWSARDGERAEVDLRNTGMYVNRVTGEEEAAIYVSTNELPLTNVFGDLEWRKTKRY